MTPLEFARARRLIAEEHLGRWVRENQRLLAARDAQDDAIHANSVRTLRALDAG